MGGPASAGHRSAGAERLKAFRGRAAKWQTVRDPMLLAEVIADRFLHLALVFVIPSGQSADVSVSDRLVVLDACAAVDPDPAIAVRDEHAHPRVRRQIAVLDPTLRAVDNEVVAIEEVPHDGQVR